MLAGIPHRPTKGMLRGPGSKVSAPSARGCSTTTITRHGTRQGFFLNRRASLTFHKKLHTNRDGFTESSTISMASSDSVDTQKIALTQRRPTTEVQPQQRQKEQARIIFVITAGVDSPMSSASPWRPSAAQEHHEVDGPTGGEGSRLGMTPKRHSQ